jgi:drug/metabolite transporter (DMT)-like permease
MGDGLAYPVLGASQIRVAAGALGFCLLYILTGKWPAVLAGAKDRRGMAFTALGALSGLVAGMSLSLLAVSRTKAGVASALMSLTPVLIVPFSAIFLKERIKPRDILGALMAAGGAALMFLA